MVGKAVYALCAILLVAGCEAQDQPNQAESTDDLMPSAETRTGASEALAQMKERHDHMETLGKATKTVNNQLKSDAPDLEQIRRSAAVIAQRAPDLVSWFPAGTGPDVGKTRAKAEIWQTPDDYETKANDFVRAAEDFDSAAKSGDLGQIESSFAALGKTCKACHDLYRAPEND